MAGRHEYDNSLQKAERSLSGIVYTACAMCGFWTDERLWSEVPVLAVHVQESLIRNRYVCALQIRKLA